jgi:hypothetical protein
MGEAVTLVGVSDVHKIVVDRLMQFLEHELQGRILHSESTQIGMKKAGLYRAYNMVGTS